MPDLPDPPMPEPDAPKAKRFTKPLIACAAIAIVLMVIGAIFGEDDDKTTTASKAPAEASTTTTPVETTRTEAPATTTTKPAPPTSTTAAPTTTKPPTTTTRPATTTTLADPRVPMPSIACGTDLQDAQDAMQEAGVFFSRSEDATGQGRRQVMDRNWTVVRQEPAPGVLVGENEATFFVVRDEEFTGRC